MNAIEQLKTSPIPANRQAARVAFFRGVHFDAVPLNNSIHTWTAPPKCCERPDGGPDYTGERRGRMTAFCYFGPGGSSGARWLVRCDCGRYEVRRIARWMSRVDPSEREDQCQACFARHVAIDRGNRRAGVSVETSAERMLRWGQELLRRGLSQREVEFLAAGNGPGGVFIETKARSIEVIRADMMSAGFVA